MNISIFYRKFGCEAVSEPLRNEKMYGPVNRLIELFFACLPRFRALVANSIAGLPLYEGTFPEKRYCMQVADGYRGGICRIIWFRN